MRDTKTNATKAQCFYCAIHVSSARINAGGLPVCLPCERAMLELSPIMAELRWVEYRGGTMTTTTPLPCKQGAH